MARTKAFDPDQVLSKAMVLFWQQGYEATSMQALVEAMGLSRSSIYATFGDKQQLYKAALIRYKQGSNAVLGNMVVNVPSGKLAISAVFSELIATSRDEMAQRGCFIINSAVELCPHDQQIATIVDQAFESTELFFVGLVEQGQMDGSISAELNPQVIGRFLLNTFFGLRVLVKTNKDRQTLDDIVATALQILG